MSTNEQNRSSGKKNMKLELKGKWLLNTILTVFLSHLSVILLLGHRFYFQKDIVGALIDYSIKGTLYVSGISLMSTTLLNKKIELIPDKNRNKMRITKTLLGIVLFIQAVFYSYSVNAKGVISLDTFQLVISLVLYVVSAILFAVFNYYNREEEKYEEAEREQRDELTEKSNKDNSSRGLNLW